MQVQRETVLRGAGSVKINTTQICSRDGITADVDTATFDVPVDGYGNVDTCRKDVLGKIAFRPCGEVTAGILAALYPTMFQTPSIGASLFGATDVPITCHSLLGEKVVFGAGAVTRMPSLKLAANEKAFADKADITCLVKNNTARTTDGSMYAVSAETWAGAFDVANLKGGVYAGTWGTGGTAVTFVTKDGWQVDFEIKTTNHEADGVGTYDITLDEVTVRAKCIPIGPSESTILGYLNAQGANALMGGSMRSGKDLVIACATGLTVTMKEVALLKGPLAWGQNTLRIGEIGFVAHRAIANGVPGALFSVAMS